MKLEIKETHNKHYSGAIEGTSLSSIQKRREIDYSKEERIMKSLKLRLINAEKELSKLKEENANYIKLAHVFIKINKINKKLKRYLI